MGGKYVVNVGWTVIPYDITVIQNGGSGSQAKPSSAKAGEKVTLDPGTRAGHEFAGWKVNSGGITVGPNNIFTMLA